jgi:hypothetical protein
VRVGFAGDAQRNAGGAGVRGRFAAGEAGHGQIDRAPEKMHRAHLAQKVGAEAAEDARRRDERMPEALGRGGVVRVMLRVLREGDRIGDFVRHRMDLDVDAQLRQRRHHPLVELRDRHRAEIDRALLAG